MNRLTTGTKSFLGSGDGSNAQQAMRRSQKGHYYVVASKAYSPMSDRDVELRKDYARSLASEKLHTPVATIRLEPKGKPKTGLTTLDEVYIIKRGVDVIGKVSIRVQVTFSSTTMIIVVFEKRIKAKETRRNTDASRGYTKKSKTQKQRRANLNRKADTRSW